MTDLAALRAFAVARALGAPTTLERALARLRFVQADPIRAPARAQDLILRHRVAGYRAGDLERRYPDLPLEEDVLHAYGFLTREAAALLHPRGTARPTGLERAVLEAARARGTVHPRDLEPGGAADLGPRARRRVTNAWGGQSRATTQALERLHRRGHLRVARREAGQRVYAPAPAPPAPRPPAERLRALALLVADLLAPVPERTLRSITSYLRRSVPGAPSHVGTLAALVREGALVRAVVDGEAYVWPAEVGAGGREGTGPGVARSAGAPDAVRLLAPFDPLVWCRGRFEHLWGWAYRFEAYTPVKKRVRGYYALPLLWRDRVIGWANASTETGSLRVEPGFVGARPRERAFRAAWEEEVARLEAFLRPWEPE